MSSQRVDWWNEETRRDKILRILAVKARELGRLPTAQDISDDPKLPIPGNLVIRAGAGNLEELLDEVAMMLYKRGRAQKRPVELTMTELAKSETERAEIERGYQEYYERQFARVMEPDGVMKLRKEGINRQFRLGYETGSVTQIPIEPRQELRKRMGSVSTNSWRTPKPEVALPKRSAAEVASDGEIVAMAMSSVAAEVAEKPKLVAKAEENQKGVDEEMARCTSKEQALEALAKVYQRFGKVTQAAIVIYARENKNSGIPAVATAKKWLGASETWTEQVEEYLALGAAGVTPAKGASPEEPPEPEVTGGSAVEASGIPDPPELPEEEKVGAVEAELAAEDTPEPEKAVKKLHLNLSGLTLRFSLEGQEYEVEVDFGK